jgi:transcriptional regulator GlxA family with amidase domain
VPAIRKRMKALQARGARYDEIVTRSNLAWALRTLGRYREALHELEVALELARATSTFNVLLEFIHYDLSVVHDALGNTAAARASYRRYLRLARPGHDSTAPATSAMATAAKRPLEPSFLKRADRYVAEHLGEPLAIEDLARSCGVSWKTLQRAFADFRGVTPVAHIRNVRLDAARRALDTGNASVAEAAGRFGFGSVTTFSLEYRRRFGVPPSRTRRRAAAVAADVAPV